VSLFPFIYPAPFSFLRITLFSGLLSQLSSKTPNFLAQDILLSAIYARRLEVVASRSFGCFTITFLAWLGVSFDQLAAANA
jgi:hypothetical protein